MLGTLLGESGAWYEVVGADAVMIGAGAGVEDLGSLIDRTGGGVDRARLARTRSSSSIIETSSASSR